MNKKFLIWTEIHEQVRKIANEIRKSNIKLTHIKGMQRGGLIPAVLLSHELGIPMLESDLGRIDDRVLIVDDICDTGTTLDYFTQFGCPTATLHYKPTASIEPMFWAEKVEIGEWIVYPWEKRDAEAIPDYLAGGNKEIKDF